MPSRSGSHEIVQAGGTLTQIPKSARHCSARDGLAGTAWVAAEWSSREGRPTLLLDWETT